MKLTEENITLLKLAFYKKYIQGTMTGKGSEEDVYNACELLISVGEFEAAIDLDRAYGENYFVEQILCDNSNYMSEFIIKYKDDIKHEGSLDAYKTFEQHLRENPNNEEYFKIKGVETCHHINKYGTIDELADNASDIITDWFKHLFAEADNQSAEDLCPDFEMNKFLFG